MASAVSATSGVFSGNTFCLRRTDCCNLRRSLSVPSWRTKAVSELGFVTSQLGGLKISYNHRDAAQPFSTPSTPHLLQPIVARRICPFTGKKANRANKVSFSNHKTKKLQFVNLQYKRVWWEAGKRYVKLRLSTKALKTIEKNGLDAVAKKAGIDLRKE
ncbi:hypothetical protein F2P56_027624 [Juglans regia]|uniref:Large ribosomal subunit protein bL28c n=2 Tax=Juglans regia TaxID=51240 RepID=A0A2I4DL86_JUGRE|nr:50S ribosomal protein L28, chloroplastic [Juglans regia]XP_035539135.1 50S ribosomal protein L28, chloroplastic-like [Juglans regia]KAF5452648.1 hypothetical protein F2P56_027622 [Juglans regia]KAF5452650.1 hypothetical protein F2P56_027624 [Juglans regia]